MLIYLFFCISFSFISRLSSSRCCFCCCFYFMYFRPGDGHIIPPTAQCHFPSPHLFVSLLSVFFFFFRFGFIFHLQWILFSAQRVGKRDGDREMAQKRLAWTYSSWLPYCFSCGCHFSVVCCAVKLKQNSNIYISLGDGMGMEMWNETVAGVESESNKLNWWVSFVSVAFTCYFFSFSASFSCLCVCGGTSTILNNNNLEPRVSRKLLLSFQGNAHLLIQNESKNDTELRQWAASERHKHVQSIQSYRFGSVLLHICSFSFFCFCFCSSPSRLFHPYSGWACATLFVCFLLFPYYFIFLDVASARSLVRLLYLYAFGSLLMKFTLIWIIMMSCVLFHFTVVRRS